MGRKPVKRTRKVSDLALAVKRELKAQGKTQAELAKQLNVHRSTVTFLFNGRIQDTRLLLLAAEWLEMDVPRVASPLLRPFLQVFEDATSDLDDDRRSKMLQGFVDEMLGGRKHRDANRGR
jgi:transcriptional regulator with XRE-family HTH domain